MRLENERGQWPALSLPSSLMAARAPFKVVQVFEPMEEDATPVGELGRLQGGALSRPSELL